jgi:Ca-activated chloride channel family protein
MQSGRAINSGVLPAKEAVRIEGMINHFAYDYPQPGGEAPFSLNADVVICPWETSHRLVRIGLRGREPIAVSEDSGIEIKFNPKYVTSYRLIGYDRQASERPNLSEARSSWEQIPTGYTLTVLYEVVVPRSKRPTTAATSTDVPATPERLLTVKLRLTTLTRGAIPAAERVVMDDGSAFLGAPEDLKFAAAVAEFGMILRDSEYKGNGSLQQVLQWADQGKGADVNGYRADFIELVRKTQALIKG